MPDLADNIKLIQSRIGQAAQQSGRQASDIQLLAVSKTQSADNIRAVWQAGISAFGENYVQEALDKMTQLGDLTIDWHFIGPIQTNKTRAIAENFSWAHSIDRLKVARRLSEQRPADLPPLNICIQVNIDGEPSKSGIDEEELETLAKEIIQLPNLRLRGLMTIPENHDNLNKKRQPFFRLHQLLATLKPLQTINAPLDTLSMGMSADMEAAIIEGATIIRVGTAIFGSRKTTA